MDDAPKGLSIDLYFSEQPLEVWKMVFRVRPPEAQDSGKDFELFQKEDKPDKRSDRFDWSQGTKGFVIALLDYKLQPQSGSLHVFSSPRRPSPAASACDALNKQEWLKDAFGVAPHTSRRISKEIFKEKLGECAGSKGFAIDRSRLPHEQIRVFCRGPKQASDKKIREIYDLLTKSWKPHHARAEKQPRKPNAIVPTGVEAGEHNKPANWVRRQREEEFGLAQAMLLEIDKKIKARRFEEAAAQCQTAEHLFGRANYITGVILCRFHLIEIYNALGWNNPDLNWVLETVQLVIREGSGWQIAGCLVGLSALSGVFTEDAANELHGKLQHLFQPQSPPVQGNPKEALRDLLLSAAGEIGRTAGLPEEEARFFMQAARLDSDDDLPGFHEKNIKLSERLDPCQHTRSIVLAGIYYARKGLIAEAVDCVTKAKGMAEKLDRGQAADIAKIVQLLLEVIEIVKKDPTALRYR